MQDNISICPIKQIVARAKNFRQGSASLNLGTSATNIQVLKSRLSKIFHLLCIRAKKLALVGLNGAGKTTLIKLMRGLYDPYRGARYFSTESL